MPTEEIDPLAEVKADIKRILSHVGGRVDDNGVYHRGLSDRVATLERALAWVTGIGTAVVLSAASALAGAFGTVPHK